MQPVDPRDKRIAELEAEVAELKKLLAAALGKIVDLEARLQQNSTNSSRPPSSDGPGAGRSPKKPKGRKRGGQPGHGPQLRALIPADRVTESREIVPGQCEHCAATLLGRDSEPRRHQVIDLPEPRPSVIEWILHALLCTRCGKVTRARLPDDAPRGNFGPGVVALVAVLTGQVGASKRKARAFLEQLLAIEVSLGTISSLEQIAADATEPAYQEAKAQVLSSDSINADETSWRENKLGAWLWVAASATAAYFVIARGRGADVAKQLLDGFAGIVSSDRWVGYNWLPLAMRQLCWAHIKRDIQGWVDRGGAGAILGTLVQAEMRKLFRWWRQVKDGQLDRAVFGRRVEKSIRPAVRELLERAAVCADAKVRGMAKQILKLEPALWTFTRVAGIDPTNNAAERAIRHAVLWRKRSFGTDSPAGSRFVAHILTVDATLRMNGGNTLAWLRGVVDAHFRHVAPPRLVLTQEHQPLSLAA